MGAEMEALDLREKLDAALLAREELTATTANYEQAKQAFNVSLQVLRAKGAVVELHYTVTDPGTPGEENLRKTGWESPKKCTKRHKAYVYASLPHFFRQLCDNAQGKGVPNFDTDALLKWVRTLAADSRWSMKAGPPPELETADGKARWALWFREVLDSSLPRARVRVRKAKHYRPYEYNKGNTFRSKPYVGGYDHCCVFMEVSTQQTLPLAGQGG